VTRPWREEQNERGGNVRGGNVTTFAISQFDTEGRLVCRREVFAPSDGKAELTAARITVRNQDGKNIGQHQVDAPSGGKLVLGVGA